MPRRRRHRPPSQIRYERSHPTISFRLDKDIKERLKNVLEGQSFADFIKEGLGVKEREKKELKKARDERDNKWYFRGYDEAVRRFGVHTICAVCGEKMIVRDPELREILGRYVREKGWGHPSCMEEVRRRREYER